MEIFDNEYHDISYSYSDDDFDEDKLQEIYDITISCLTDSNYAEFTMKPSFDLYQIDKAELN